MPIHITPHHLRLSPALKRFVRKKVSAVARVANDILAAEIVLRRNSSSSGTEQFSASARLALPGRDIHSTAANANLYAAVLKLTARLARLSRKRKTRLAKSFKATGKMRSKTLRAHNKNAGSPLPPKEARDDKHSRSRASLLHAVGRCPRVREDGQESRVFVFRRRAPFDCAPEARLHAI